MPRARLVDVAAEAGVSTATASLVLRGRPGPSRASREAVEGAARRLAYRPDRTASLLASRRSRHLGVLIVIMANKKSVIGDLRNRWWQNLFGAIGLIAIVASSLRLITTLIG